MTPEHKFQLLTTIIPVVPATILSAWALISQLRQTKPRLQIMASPMMSKSIDGKQLLTDDWPGVVVRNLSPFSVRICNIGYVIDKKKFYQFGRPLDSHFKEMEEWPHEIFPRQRLAFYLNQNSLDGQNFISAIPQNVKHNIWRVGLCYALTECGNRFFSKPVSEKSLKIFNSDMKRDSL